MADDVDDIGPESEQARYLRQIRNGVYAVFAAVLFAAALLLGR